MNRALILTWGASTLLAAAFISSQAYGHTGARQQLSVRPAGGGHAGWNDYNGDGYDDLAIGTPQDTVAGKQSAGSVTVLYGGPNGLHASDSDYWTQASTGIAGGPEVADQFGSALASGDLDDDGFADLAIGIPQETLGPGKEVAGAVEVIYGSAAGLTYVGSRLLAGSVAGQQFGTALATLDNIDSVADGSADLAVGAPGNSMFYVISGPVIAVGLQSGWSKTVPGVLSARSFAVGNFDSDGVDDLAVGSPFAGFQYPGRVDVYTGHSVKHYTPNNLSIPPQQTYMLGAALAAGDLDGDGLDELIMGEPGRLPGGAVLIAPSTPSGPDASAVELVTPSNLGLGNAVGSFGTAIAVGHFDAGGVLDLAVGSSSRTVGGNGAAGSVAIRYNGSSASWITQSTPGIADSPGGTDHFGAALSVADWGRGGRSDLAIGVPGESVSRVKGAGAVHILYGSASGLSPSTSSLFSQGALFVVGDPAKDDLFGALVH